MNADELGRDWFDYVDRCKAAGKPWLTFTVWQTARLNALEDTLQTILAILQQWEADGR